MIQVYRVDGYNIRSRAVLKNDPILTIFSNGKKYNMLVGNGLIDHLLAVAPHLKEIFGRDVVVWISDRTRILGYFRGYSFHVQTDSVLYEGDPMLQAMEKKKTMHANIPEDMFGVPFKEVDSPIADEQGNVIGCITVGITLDQETKVANVANDINEAVVNIDTTVSEFTSSAENIRTSEKELKENMVRVKALTEEISKVLEAYTKKVTVQTKLLGLNAAIEATQAGRYGFGFGVVADEIAHLSDESLVITKNIESLISQISTANKEMLASYESVHKATEKQIVSSEKTRMQIKELKSTSDILKSISKEI